jgi:Fe-S-cluster containining protein
MSGIVPRTLDLVMNESANDSARRPAGEFSTWLAELLTAIRDGTNSAVPCDGCVACCSSSQFVHIGPGESDALRHIPAELLFGAPGMPDGYVLMGYDERGRCPMLGVGGCSIYEHRPRTCRTYDCRVFPAAGVMPGEGKELIAGRANEWEFDYADERARVEHAAVQAAAAYLETRRDDLPPGAVPRVPTQLAVLACEAHDAFLDTDHPEPAAVRVAIRHRPPG